MKLYFNPLSRETNVIFLSVRSYTLGISALLVLGSLVLMLTPGLNFGIDFLGGTQVTVPTSSLSLVGMQGAVQEAHPFLSGVEMQAFGENARFIMPKPDEVQLAASGLAEADFMAQRRADALQALGLDDSNQNVTFETIGGQVSSELQTSAMWAVLIALAGIAAYIAFRFEWRFAVAALVALLHDAITTIGLFALLQMELNLEVVAAILTIAGYSINDTVVVFDRIREEMRKSPDEGLESLLNRSLNRTLSRTIMTSITTMLALLMLFWFAGADVREFSTALIWGVLIGTYSSLFLATPLLKVMGLSSKVFEKQKVDLAGMDDAALAWASKIEDTSVEALDGTSVSEGSSPKRTKGKPRKGKKKN